MARTTQASTVEKKCCPSCGSRKSPSMPSACLKRTMQQDHSPASHHQRRLRKPWSSLRRQPAEELISRNRSTKLAPCVAALPTTFEINTRSATHHPMRSSTEHGEGLRSV